MENKKIGIITFSTSLINYGQILQAYALQSYLRDKGYNAFLINYDMWGKMELNREVHFPYLKHFIKNLPLVRKHYERNFHNEPNLRNFIDFKKKYLIYTPKVYHTLKDLQRDPVEADVYLTGSDQVWGTGVPNLEPYLLNFGNPTTPRIAYAASFGRTSFSKHELKYIPPLLAKYKAVGVREYSGIEACKKLGYPNAVFTPDPTILKTKSDWEQIASKSSPFKTNKTKIFVYSCYLPKGTLTNIAHQLEGDNEILVADIVNEDSNYSHLTIEEWISAVKNADYIVTNSFHCTMFSLYFNKPFVVFKYRLHKGGSMNTRLDSILSQTGLTYRFLSFDEHRKTEEVLKEKIDWNNINEELDKLRQIGVKFLKDNISC